MPDPQCVFANTVLIAPWLPCCSKYCLWLLWTLAHSGGDIDSLVLDGRSSVSPALYGCGVSVEASRGSQALVMRAGGSARVPVWAPVLPPHLLLHVSMWRQAFLRSFYHPFTLGLKEPGPFQHPGSLQASRTPRTQVLKSPQAVTQEQDSVSREHAASSLPSLSLHLILETLLFISYPFYVGNCNQT